MSSWTVSGSRLFRGSLQLLHPERSCKRSGSEDLHPEQTVGVSVVFSVPGCPPFSADQSRLSPLRVVGTVLNNAGCGINVVTVNGGFEPANHRLSLRVSRYSVCVPQVEQGGF